MSHILGTTTARIYIVFLGIAFGALSFISTVQAQAPDLPAVNDQTQTPIPGAGHDYQHLLGETVNPSNGSVSFKISFPMPKGRGITLPYEWSYDSALVNPLNIEFIYTPIWDDLTVQTGPEQDGWNTHSGFPYATVSVWNQTPPPNENQTFAGCNIQSGMTFTDMTGTMHNLYTSAQVTASTQSGLVQTCGPPATVGPAGDGQVTGKPDPNTEADTLERYLSEPETGSFIVTDKNGTVYSFNTSNLNPDNPNMLVWPSIEDRNGNEIGYTSPPTITGGVPGLLCTSSDERDWTKRSGRWRRARSIHLNRL